MKFTLLAFSLGISVLFVFSCSSEQPNEIEAELIVHFDTFVNEAALHGMDISLSDIDISGYVEHIEHQGTLGQCKSYSDGSKQVVIDGPFWENADNLEREYVVFHELGHCILGREHNDGKDGNGQCISIMQSGNQRCEGIYTLENRNSLLQELFNF